jgi:branched-chain amino acid transport system permease protein
VADVCGDEERCMAALSGSFELDRSTRSSRATAWLGAAAVAVLLSMPLWAGSSALRQFTELACLLVMAQMWNLLGGYGGMVSIGQQMYIGAGGYALIALANFGGLNPFLCVPLAGLVAAALALPASGLLFRLQGGYFAIGTWAVAEIARGLVANLSVLGGGSGTSLTALRGIPRPVRESVTFWIAVAAVVGSIGGVYWLLRSRYGLALAAIRDSEVAASSQGVHVPRVKLAVYLLSAFGFGVAGALYFLSALRISPDAAFGVQWSPVVIFMVVIGGLGTIEGPLLGALLYFALSKLFADYGTWYLIALGLFAIAVTIRFPSGLWGFVNRRFDLRCFPVQRRIREPRVRSGALATRAQAATTTEDSS